MMRFARLAICLGAAAAAAVSVGSAGCASVRSEQSLAATVPPPVSETDPVRLRACQSCRQSLELCNRGSSGASASGSRATCVDDFMLCLRAQSLEAGQCTVD